MSEILLSLTIIGVVAAITLPSLTGNINEKVWNTQRKALYARMSQAISLMPALNGYGEIVIEQNSDGEWVVTKDTTAMSFLNDGLTKVLKINNICDHEHFQDCGIPEQIKVITLQNERKTSYSTITVPKRLKDLNSNYHANLNIHNNYGVAFETQNGESVIVFYNPNCTTKDILIEATDVVGNKGVYVKHHLCANFVYDLNGKKGPNTVGKDIGFIGAIYPYDTSVIMPLITNVSVNSVTHERAISVCKSKNPDYRLPSVDEMISIYWNMALVGERHSWTSDKLDVQTAYKVSSIGGVKYPTSINGGEYAFCVKRN